MTNGERIRSMTDEELAEFLNGILSDCDYCPMWAICHETALSNCGKICMQWLKSEVKND